MHPYMPETSAAKPPAYALSICRLDSIRSIKVRKPNSLDMARDSSRRDMALDRSPSLVRSRSTSA